MKLKINILTNKPMKKILFFSLAVVLSATLVGCTNLGDQLGSKFNNNNNAPATNEEPSEQAGGQQDNQNNPATNKEEVYNKIFFGLKPNDNTGRSCWTVYWVTLSGDDQLGALERNLKLLLAGPTSKWAAAGYYSVIPAGTKLNSVKLDNGVVYTDFSSELGLVDGDCAKQTATSQITETVKAAAKDQLNQEVGKVVITVDGKAF